MFTVLRLRVITDWRHAWKWSSMRFLALGGVIQGAIITTPDAVKEHVPEWVMQGMSCFALWLHDRGRAGYRQGNKGE
jgi:hypothetical protein